jgi:hypothetical protein
MTLSKLLAGSLFVLSGLGIAEAILLALLGHQGPKGGPAPTPIRIVGGSIQIMSSDPWTCDKLLQTCTSVDGNFQFKSYTVTTTPVWFPSSDTTANPTATTTTENYRTASGDTANGTVVVSIAAGGYIQAKATTGTFELSANKNLTYRDTNCDPYNDTNGCRFRMNGITVTDSNGNTLGGGSCPTVLGLYKCEVDLKNQ